MDFKDKTVAFATLGCKLNFSETSTIARSFEEKGFKRVNFKEKADVYVINTCSVTDTADKKSRTVIRQAAKINPAAFIIVTGCYAQLKPDEAAHIEGVDLVIGANDKFNIIKYLENLGKHHGGEIHTCAFGEISEFQHAWSFGDRTRSFLKVQDGCNYFCTYCTIPMARGKSRNPSIESLVDEARNVAEQGIREIILTGVNIGDFGHSTGETFLALIKALDEVETLGRIRIGSVEPNLLTDEIITFMAESKRIAPHYHIPLQAGTDEILHLMKRRYTTSLFAERVSRIRELLPYAFIGVDLIAGMNGETGELFEKAYQFIERLDISELHVFPYSERKNTRALKISGVVPVEERRQRAQQLIKLSEQKLKDFYRRNIGKRETVLFENEKTKGFMQGWTANYIKVETQYRPELLNEFRTVKLCGLNENGTMNISFE
ncbi:MAG: tRNA (N(6)-L-threonylcarbamoyladenosine(37)-C(2))-methylthiotransferase MtaB [Bacteroidia bacterium]|nr:tRNA (N(6)-L-threonylcarbamoyladenosine(37)-C(2))-methylthiotransferase MtaB [Bacteroidia bacterium]